MISAALQLYFKNKKKTDFIQNNRLQSQKKKFKHGLQSLSTLFVNNNREEILNDMEDIKFFLLQDTINRKLFPFKQNYEKSNRLSFENFT